MPLTLLATTAMGEEAVVKRELQALGYEPTEVREGRVAFQAEPEAVARANLWLRSAARLKLVVGEFEARTFDELFERTRALPWPDLLPGDADFPVLGRSTKSTLFSISDCQAIVKKAIVEALRPAHPELSWFPEDGPLFTVEVALLKDLATITIDTSGDALHKRGYREEGGEAPLRETLAASLVSLSYWSPDRLLLDPFCGAGTIAIEAALAGRGIAPGLRRRFASEDWPWLPQAAWRQARAEAYDAARPERSLDIRASDRDPQAVALARANAEAAGVEDALRLEVAPASRVAPDEDYGVLISNLPYGERSGAPEDVAPLIRALGRAWRKRHTWCCYWLSNEARFERLYGAKADRRRKLYNGPIRTWYYQYLGPPPPREPEGG